jgi:hypothetical protein
MSDQATANKIHTMENPINKGDDRSKSHSEDLLPEQIEEGRPDEEFSLNVVNLSYRPSGKAMREQINNFKVKMFQLNLGWVLANFNDIGKNTGANLYNVNFKAKGGELTAILGNASERRELVDLIAGRKKNGTFDGDISLRGCKLSKSSEYHDNVGFVQSVRLVTRFYHVHLANTSSMFRNLSIFLV